MTTFYTPTRSRILYHARMQPNPDEQYCYLTTTGRVSGKPREIEIWFGMIGAELYMLSGSGSEGGRPKAHWVRNLVKQPAVTVRVGETAYPGVARVVEPGTAEDAAARELLVSKYRASSSSDLSNWGRTAVVVGVTLASPLG